MSLLSVLSTGSRALAASQLAMDVAGQNISNADVEGYSRKRLNMSPDYRYDSTYGQMGMGVEVINIERVRSSFIDKQIQRQNTEVGYYTQLDVTMESIENILNEPGDTGLLYYVDQFFDSWENLSNNPSDTSARTALKTNSEILTDVFHSVAGELSDLRQTRNDEIEQTVDRVNEICAEVYNLNLEISAVELGKQNANDSRDKRDMLLKELSGLVDIDVIENDLGQVTITTSGNILVAPSSCQRLETFGRIYTMSDGSERTETGIRFANSKNVYDPQGGELDALIESRDSIIPKYQQQLDEFALSLASSVNELHTRGYTLNGYSGISFFSQTMTGALDISLSPSISSDVRNIAAAAGGESYPGARNDFAAGTHDFGMTPLQLYRDPSVASPVEADNIVRGTVVVSTSSVTLVEDVDYHIDYTNGTIQMLHSGYDGEDISVDFEYSTGGFSGPGDNANALAIAALRSDLTMTEDILGNPTATFTDYYSSMISEIGLSRNEASSNLETRQFLVTQYESQQDSIAGVSLDEEMANIIKYQNTYTAAARVISTADEMLQVLMDM